MRPQLGLGVADAAGDDGGGDDDAGAVTCPCEREELEEGSGVRLRFGVEVELDWHSGSRRFSKILQFFPEADADADDDAED